MKDSIGQSKLYGMMNLVSPIAAVTGITTLFLPLTEHYRLAEVIPELIRGFERGCLGRPSGAGCELFLVGLSIAAPFFLPIFIFGASIRMMSGRLLSRYERAFAHTISTAVACLTLYLQVQVWEYGDRSWSFMVPPITIALGFLGLRTTTRFQATRSFSAIIALQVAYLSSFLFVVLVDAWGERQAGAYCAVATALAYLLQILMLIVISRSQQKRALTMMLEG